MDFYISKTDFKIGSDCHRKLYYKKNGYPTLNDENEYMQYLAKGGYIVGKMAQAIYAGGIDLSAIANWKEAFAQTSRLLQTHSEVIIYEATIYAKGKLVRVDILKKEGNVLHVIEVKAKSQHSDDDSEKMPRPYLDDVLYQVVTAEEAFPEYEVRGFLFLPDKSRGNQIEGLAGWFIVEEALTEVPELDELAARSTPRFSVPTVRFKYENDPRREEYLALLRQHSVLELRDIRHADFGGDWAPAKEVVKNLFQNLYESVQEGRPGVISKKCKACEYNAGGGGKNGFKECWRELEDRDLSALDLYYGGAVVQGKGNYYLDELIRNRTLGLSDIDVAVLTKGKTPDKLSGRATRQLLQIQAAREGREKVHLNELARELEGWQYPLHFIDFETFTGAVPFHRLMPPYETIAFQWSCHTLHADGRMEHREWINLEETFPNFRFAEALMEAVGNGGTPLMWSHHENTVLRHIEAQMEVHGYANAPLKNWLLRMTHDSGVGREGRLVDMAKVCERTYVHPSCKGKVSIKKILPAIWKEKSNRHLHEHPEFSPYFKVDDFGNVLDPYNTLGAVEAFLDASTLEAEEVIAEGTAAMKAYFELMYGRGANHEGKKEEIKTLLLQYCKLDTAAMVIIYQYWKTLVVRQKEMSAPNL